MSTYLLFDAMNYIDDDMLEDVNALRSQKRAKSRNVCMRYVSIAACVCIVFAVMFFASQYGFFDDVTMQDSAEHGILNGKDKHHSEFENVIAPTDDFDGHSIVHSYVRAEITANGASTQTITEAQDITAIFDILHYVTSAESENDNLHVKQDPSKESFDFAVPESASENAAKQYKIMLVNADGSEVVYTLTGKHVKNEATGISYILPEKQYNELMEVLNNK